LKEALNMTFFELMLKRESCRDFADRPVEPEKLKACMEAALVAPSACNSQPWRYILVTEPELVSALAKCFQDPPLPINTFTSGAKAFAIVCEGRASLIARAGGKVKDQKYALMDLGMSVMQMCLSASDQGLGTCILGWMHEDRVKKLLGVPADVRVRLGIAVGYPKNETPRPKKRRSYELSVCLNRWGLEK